MKRFRRLRKVLFYGLPVVLLLLVAAVAAARLYLSSDAVVQKVVTRLEDVFGGPVHLDGVDISLGGDSALKGLEVYPPGSEKPWIKVADIDADVSALGLLAGNGPRNVVLQAPQVTLHLNEEHHLLTPLPTLKETTTAVPRVHIQAGKFTIDQDGRPPMAVSGLQAEMMPTADGIRMEGTIHDPYWGDWNLELTLDTSTKALGLRLTSGPTHITMEKLRALPVISKHVWEEVQIEGITPVVFEMTYRPAAAGETSSHVHHRVELEPRDTTVHVSSIKLDADQARGKVVIEDKVVTLTDVQGRTAEGEIKTDAVLDFRSADSEMKFKIDVQDVVLHALPKGWKIPPKIDGKLSGHADLDVTVVKGHAITLGAGKGSIRDARVELPLLGVVRPTKPVQLTLRADAKGFHFLPDLKTAALSPTRAVALALPPVTMPAADNFLSLHGRPDVCLAGLSLLQQPARGPPENVLEVDLTLDDADLAEMTAGVGTKVALPLAGRLSLHVRVGVPMDTPGDFKAYRLSGTATASRLDMAGVQMTGVRAQVSYADGVLRLTELTGRVGQVSNLPGQRTFSGTARLEAFPPGELTADLRLDDIPLDGILALLPGADDAAGSLSGELSARAPVERLEEPAAWEGKAALRSDRIHLYGLTLTGAAARLVVRDGSVLLRDLDARLEGAPVNGAGEASLVAPYPCKARVELGDIDLAALERLAPALRPPVPLSGRLRLDADLRGTLRPLAVHASGKGRGTGLVVDGVAVDSLAFEWAHDGGDLKVRSLQARMYDGEVSGSIDVPAAPDAGKADLRVRDLDMQGLMKAFPLVPMRLEGRVSGTLQGSLGAAGPDRRRTLAAQVELDASRLRVQGLPVEKVHGSFDYRDGGAADYRLGGESLGGHFRLEGSLPPRDTRPPEVGVPPSAGSTRPRPPEGGTPTRKPDGRFVVEGVRLARLWEAYRLQDFLGPLQGVVSIHLPFRHEGPGGRPVGSGRVEIQELRWDGQDLAEGFRGGLRLGPGELDFRDVAGSLGQGLVRAHVRVPLRQGEDGSFSLILEQVEASRLLVPWPEIASRVQGLLDVSLRGRLASETLAGGEVALSHGRVLGVEVGEGRFPIQIAFSAREGQGEWTIGDGHAALAHGRVLGRARLNWGGGIRLEGELRFHDVDLHTLAASSSEGTSLAAGRLDGRIDFSGSEVRSLDDLSATISATLHQAQALQLPVLRQVTPYVRAGMSSSTFQSGQLEARLSHGLVRLQRLTLEGGILQMVVEGTITLAGRLNLEVSTRTNNPTPVPGLGLLRVPAAGAMPLSLITEASILLANRVVRLRVAGTVHNPVIQVEPGRLLTEEAVRFFLRPAGLTSP